MSEGGLYLTNAELARDGLALIFRHLDHNGLPIAERPMTPPHFEPPEAFGVDIQVAIGDGILQPVVSGMVGSLMAGTLVYRYEVPFAEQLAIDVHTPDGRTVSVKLQ